MSLAGKAVLGVVLFSVIFWVACNDAFRPIAQVIPVPGPDPGRLNRAFVLSTNGANIGGFTSIDTSGDTVVGIQYVGHQPANQFVFQGGGRGFIANQIDDTVTALTPANLIAQPSTIPLPAGAAPGFLFTSVANFVWVTEPGLGRVGQISFNTNTLTNEIAVGSNPVYVAETPSGQKVYVVNQGSNDVTVIQTVDGTVLGTIPVGSSPVAAVASSDGNFVFVADQGSNDVAVIDTTNDATVLTTIPLGASPSAITYDPGLRRVYTANTGSNSVSILRADQPSPTLPTLLTTVDVTAAPCGGSAPAQVAVLPDGSRAYVANTGSNNVCVITALSNTVTKSIPVGTAPLSVAVSVDATRAYTANSGSHDISIILTAGDTPLVDSSNNPVRPLAPKTDPNCVDPAPPTPPVCTRMNPLSVTTR